MQKIVTSLFLTCAFITFVTPANAAKYVVGEKLVNSFNLNIGDPANEKEQKLCCVEAPDLRVGEEEPSAGEQNLIDQMKVAPQFRYGKNEDDYNNRNVYDTEVKVNVRLPVDIDF